MISLYHATDDPFSRYGINHFIEKFGIPVEINKPSQSGISVVYDTKAKGDFFIEIKENEIQNRICGRICTENDKIPICEIPFNTGEGNEVLAWFENEHDRYPCITLNEFGVTIGIDIFKQTGYILSGHLDSIWPSLDSITKKELVSKPCDDFLENILFNAILSGFHKKDIPLVHKAFWPEGKSFALSLTHDVDELKKSYQWITQPWKHVKNRNFLGLYNQYLSFKQKVRGNEPYWTFEPILRMEDELGVKSSFYFLNEKAVVQLTDRKTWRHSGRRYDWNSPQVKDIMKKMDSEGWEIGLHGSFFSYIDYEKIRLEKNALEKALDASPIVGVRQHNLNLKIPDTWIGQEKSGLIYDTTLGYNECIGFRWGTCLPFHPHIIDDKRPLKLLEIPLIIEDLPFFKNIKRREDTIKIIREVMDQHGVLTLLWHHTVFNDYEFPGGGSAYKRIIDYCKKRDAWITSGKNIAQWWLQREMSDFMWIFDGRILSIKPKSLEMPLYYTIYYPKNFTLKFIKNAIIVQLCQDFSMIKVKGVHPNECLEIEFEVNKNAY